MRRAHWQAGGLSPVKRKCRKTQIQSFQCVVVKGRTSQMTRSKSGGGVLGNQTSMAKEKRL